MVFRVLDGAAFVADGLGELFPEGLVGGIEEHDLALLLFGFVGGEDPQVGLDAGVVEHLLGQGDEGHEPVVFEDPAADFRLAGTGLAGEEGRAIEDDADVAGCVLVHMVEHVLEEEELAVGDAWQAGTEAGVVAELRLGGDGVLVRLPLVAVGRIGELEVEGGLAELVLGEGGAELDGVAVRLGGIEQEEVGLADGPGARVDFLAEDVDAGLRGDLADFLAGDGDDAAGAAGRVGHGAGGSGIGGEVGIQCEDEADEQADHVLGGEVLAGVLVDVFVEAPDELLEEGAHLVVVEAVRVFL